MDNELTVIKNKTWRYIDQTSFGTQFFALQSFAYDDALCTSVGQNEHSHSVIRTWVHPKTVVLGIQDSRLPMVTDGIQYLQEQGYNTIVRNSGGLAVVLDAGILNISLIMKEQKKFSIDSGYELMFSVIKQMFKPYDVLIEAREIIGSYCPGSFDLSIGGKKFAGISQRRIRGGVAVQIYLCLQGSGQQRASLIRTFYEKAVGEMTVSFEYPRVQPETMASLTDLLQSNISISHCLHRLLTVFTEGGAQLQSDSVHGEEIDLYSYYLNRVIKRNEKALQA
ncbi:biotin/lipoate A/B protein ligase family protein [Alkalihalobacillus sp. LMS39]|uniref:lipoate--protein ligase family protein n=1 Tax=Alkalihalobacillus sp. LMS39 TaxID=2924032 RepID=UPI001FB1F710|nr:biotin/lipoate A/B protein ligase family protein [Alkalihalobacillus sp. LMS39]UOE93994.1 lipoate--protein ligase family protein [Alkalihalobacillus sp. LMS39]